MDNFHCRDATPTHVQTLFAIIVHSVLLTQMPIGFGTCLFEPYVLGFILLLTGHHAW